MKDRLDELEKRVAELEKKLIQDKAIDELLGSEEKKFIEKHLGAEENE